MAFWSKSAIRDWLPRLQCHRGYWIEGLQQNSFQSVQEAFRRGYKIAEFDVRMTKDQVVVLFHDETYQGHVLGKTTYLDFKKIIQPEFPALSKLEDVLTWMREGLQADKNFDFKLNIEIKSKKIFDGRIEKKIFDLLCEYNLLDRVLVSSFNPLTLFRMRRYQPNLRRALLLTHSDESNLIANQLWLNFLAAPHVLHLRWNDLDEKTFRQVGGKVPIVLWTVNDVGLIQKNKIFGVISDRITPQEFAKIEQEFSN